MDKIIEFTEDIPTSYDTLKSIADPVRTKWIEYDKLKDITNINNLLAKI